MKCVSEVAIQNVLFLSQRDMFLSNRYILSGKEFVEGDSDSLHTVYSFAELEFPLYFTFHQVMNHIHSSYDHKICGHTRKELLDHMERGIDTLVEYYASVDPTDETFEALINDLDDKVYMLYGYYKDGWCLWLPTKVKELFNRGCDIAITVSREIIKEHIQYLQEPVAKRDKRDKSKRDKTQKKKETHLKREGVLTR